MKKSYLVILALILSSNFLPSFADDLDQECIDFCKNNGQADGHYLPQEPGSACKEGFTQDEENQICCCK